MPREMIQSGPGPYHVKVGWRAEHGVQVGVEGDDGRSIFWLLFDGEDRMKIGAAVKALLSNTSDAEPDPLTLAEAVLNILDTVASGDAADEANPHGSYTGLWATLDRGGVNHLVRVLRRARDAAFGRDE